MARPHDAIEGLVPGVAGMHDDDYPEARTIPGLLVHRELRRELAHRGIVFALARVKQDLLDDLTAYGPAVCRLTQDAADRADGRSTRRRAALRRGGLWGRCS